MDRLHIWNPVSLMTISASAGYQPEYRKKAAGIMSTRSALLLAFSKVQFGSLCKDIEYGTKPTGDKFRLSLVMTDGRTVQFICSQFTV